MSKNFSYMPPTTFRFSVVLLQDFEKDKNDAMNYLNSSRDTQSKSIKFGETSFKSVSGLEATLETEPANIGGVNDRTFALPQKVKYSNLVLSRGIAIKGSYFTNWFWLQQQKDGVVIKKDLLVSLLSPQGAPMVVWLVLGAYPVSWKTTNLDATENQIQYEEVELAYTNFEIIKQ